MRKTNIILLVSLLVILSPSWLFSERVQDKGKSLTVGYVAVRDVVWEAAQGKPEHPQRGVFYIYVPMFRATLTPHESGAVARYQMPAGRYEAVAYSSKARFDIGVTHRDHSPFHAGVVSDTYYLEYFSFEVKAEKVTLIQGYIGSYRTENLQEADKRNSGGYIAYWEPRIKSMTIKPMARIEPL